MFFSSRPHRIIRNHSFVQENSIIRIFLCYLPVKPLQSSMTAFLESFQNFGFLSPFGPWNSVCQFLIQFPCFQPFKIVLQDYKASDEVYQTSVWARRTEVTEGHLRKKVTFLDEKKPFLLLETFVLFLILRIQRYMWTLWRWISFYWGRWFW